MSGVAAIAEALKGNVTLQSVRCALPFSPLLDQLAHRALAPSDTLELVAAWIAMQLAAVMTTAENSMKLLRGQLPWHLRLRKTPFSLH